MRTRHEVPHRITDARVSEDRLDRGPRQVGGRQSPSNSRDDRRGLRGTRMGQVDQRFHRLRAAMKGAGGGLRRGGRA